ncbi:MAG: CrcB family protein [Pseudomonadota bacterium]
MRDFFLICLAGAFGTGARYAVSNVATTFLGARFAVGTLAVNLLGCLLIGVMVALGSDLIPAPMRGALMLGFLGAFTTFSTFGYETFHYFEGGDWKLAVANIAANLLLGLLAVGGGLALGRGLLSLV